MADIIQALQNGPVAAAIYAPDDLQFYKGPGLYTSSACPAVQANGQCGANHAVVIVGYGTDASGNLYWKIRNSWGPGFGVVSVKVCFIMAAFTKWSFYGKNQCFEIKSLFTCLEWLCLVATWHQLLLC